MVAATVAGVWASLGRLGDRAAPARLALLLISASLTATAFGHHPEVDLAALAGTRLCVDSTSVTVTTETRAASQEAAIADRLSVVLEQAPLALALPIARAEACPEGLARLSLAASAIPLEPRVYVGYPPGAVSILLSLTLTKRTRGSEETLFHGHQSDLYWPTEGGPPVEEHLAAIASRGVASFARSWWQANEADPVAPGSLPIAAIAVAAALASLLLLFVGTSYLSKKQLAGPKGLADQR